MENNKPAHQIQLGSIRVTLWANLSEYGVLYDVVVSRSYRKEEEWKRTSRLRGKDLLEAAEALRQAHQWIYAQAKAPE